MKKLFLWAALMVAAAFSSCKYDDGDIWNSVYGLESRVAKLEELCKQLNTNISSLQAIVTALQNNDYVTGVAPVTSNGEIIGYTISFTKSAPITIYHGQDGKDGANGSDGKDGLNGSDGKDGHTPIIGVRQDTDGIYYWTLDSEWLLDNTGNKIKAEGRDGQNGADGKPGEPGKDGQDGKPGEPGKDGQDGQPGADGKDGITPQLKIENGYWYVSTDNGSTWTNLGKATGDDGKDGQDGANGSDGKDGEDGDSFFKSVTQDENYVYFTLADGEIITLPKSPRLAISFAEGTSLTFDIDETKTVNYTITGGNNNNIVKAEMQNNDGVYTLYTTTSSVSKGKIRITAGIPTSNRVIVSVSDGIHTIMAAIDVMLKPSFDGNVISVETPGTLADLIANYDKTTITELTVIGNLNNSDIGTLRKLPNLTVLDIKNTSLSILPDRAFFSCSMLTNITLPRSVTSIGDEAFKDCSSLTSITIPDSVTSVASSVFEGCSNLSNVVIPNSVTSIGSSAFKDCSSLTSIAIPSSITKCGYGAFYNCKNLSDVYITDIAKWCNISFMYFPSGYLSSYKYSCNPLYYAHNLYLNDELVTNLVIPEGVTSIGNYAFYGCRNLTSVTFPASLTSIGDSAFYSCRNLAGNLKISENVVTIGDYAFCGCIGLATELVIGDKVQRIGHYAFENCSGLNSLVIGSGVTTIGDHAFNGSKMQLKQVYCKALTPPYCSSAPFASISYTLDFLGVPAESVAAYQESNYWGTSFKVIEASNFNF